MNIARRTALALCTLWAGEAAGQPVVDPWPAPADTVAAASNAYAGFFATADTFLDHVVVRNRRGEIVREITRADLASLAPWLSLGGGPDGVNAMCFSPSGKQLFIQVHDDTAPGDGLPTDAIVRLDLATNSLVLFARAELFDRGDAWPHLAIVHHKAMLYSGSNTGSLRVFLANSAATTGSPMATWTLPTSGPIRGLAVDRDRSVLFAANDHAIYRTPLTNNFAIPPAWTLVSTTPGVVSLAWAEAYAGPERDGLYFLNNDGGQSNIAFIGATDAHGPGGVIPSAYLDADGAFWHDVAASGDGRIVAASGAGAVVISDSSDSRLSFEEWLRDEFSQVLSFSRGLISPDGEPAGWVIDADTDLTMPRFHPATPDGAAWVVLMLLASSQLNDDPFAPAQIREILTRYAGLSPDGISPSRSVDGIYRYWIDPQTGSVKPGWDPEFATMSTMKIVCAAARAMEYFPDDPVIARAASRIIFRVRNWDAYIQAGTRALYLKALAGGGPDTGVPLRPFHEGILFVEQAAAYGGASSDVAYAAWLNRGLWPTASYAPAHPITTINPNVHEASFLSLYPALLTPDYRSASAWRSQVSSIRWSAGAWSDDFTPKYITVFSAGTTRADWGGYHADTLGDHPGNVSTFPSLMACASFGDESPAVQAYHAYRKGARQAFRTGASILYRRSDVDRSYSPNSAGLPDVALGALTLADLLQPGLIDSVLSRANPRAPRFPADLSGEGVVTIDDVYTLERAPTDLNGDGVANADDVQWLKNWTRRHEAADWMAR